MQIPRVSFELFNKGHISAARYALLSYSTDNLGDEIQSIAARSFLPKFHALVDRDHLAKAPLTTPHKIILNGWYSHRPENWPPSRFLDPFITSFHVSGEIARENVQRRPFADRVKEQDSIDYLNAHGPIGVRDYSTGAYLRQLGVPSYFSGCLTLTLSPKGVGDRLPYVCVNDLDNDVAAYVQQRCGLRIIKTTHTNASVTDPAKRFELANDLLSLYASATFVVTSRLHCALPCLALGTPVLFCPVAKDTYRFSGLFALLRHTTRQDLLGNRAPFDLGAPSPNPDTYRNLRDNLIERCNSFITTSA